LLQLSFFITDDSPISNVIHSSSLAISISSSPEHGLGRSTILYLQLDVADSLSIPPRALAISHHHHVPAPGLRDSLPALSLLRAARSKQGLI